MPQHTADDAGQWTPDAKIDRWAARNKFGSAHPLTEGELRALSKAHGGKPRGLYMFECLNHQVYVGISEDSVCTRLRSHRKHFADFEPKVFRYRTFEGDREQLREIERDLIWSSTLSDHVVLNREHSSAVVGKTTLDKLVPVDEQLQWLADPAQTNRLDASAFSVGTPSQLAKSKVNYDKFVDRPDAAEIIDVLGAYLANCVPFPVRTETRYWGLSCLPNTTLADGWRRLVTVNMGMLEMLWITQRGSDAPVVFMGTDSRFLPVGRRRLKSRMGGVTRRGLMHKSGGAHEMVLEFKSPAVFLAAVEEFPELATAAARFALDRMRMGALSGRYADAHNFSLAADALRHTPNL